MWKQQTACLAAGMQQSRDACTPGWLRPHVVRSCRPPAQRLTTSKHVHMTYTVQDTRTFCRPHPAAAKATESGDMAKGGWAGAYSKNIPNDIYPNGIVSAVSSEWPSAAAAVHTPTCMGSDKIQTRRPWPSKRTSLWPAAGHPTCLPHVSATLFSDLAQPAALDLIAAAHPTSTHTASTCKAVVFANPHAVSRAHISCTQATLTRR